MTTNTETPPVVEDLGTIAVCEKIRKALHRRSGYLWRVYRGRGTSSGWINVEPKNGLSDVQWKYDIKHLADLMGLAYIHDQGLKIPASHDYYREYIDRAEGRTPRKIAEPYW